MTDRYREIKGKLSCEYMTSKYVSQRGRSPCTIFLKTKVRNYLAIAWSTNLSSFNCLFFNIKVLFGANISNCDTNQWNSNNSRYLHTTVYLQIDLHLVNFYIKLIQTFQWINKCCEMITYLLNIHLIQYIFINELV